MNFRDYIKTLAEQHTLIHHDDNGECHFSSLAEEAQNLFARRMHYPCVALSLGDIIFSSQTTPGAEHREVTILFLDHATDTGDYDRIRSIFDTTETIMKDFVARMDRDRKKLVKPVTRFNYTESEAQQIYLEAAGLYGWALTFTLTNPFNTIDCNHHFDDENPAASSSSS